MPCRIEHIRFNYFLEDEGIINSAEDGGRITGWMDKNVTKFGGWTHQQKDPHHSLNGTGGVRDRLHIFADHGYEQNQLTDLFRMGAGHLALDEAKHDNPEADSEFLRKKALRIMKRNGWDRSFYRHP
jgi:hypothetical protein